MANPRTDHAGPIMDADFRFPSIYVPSTCTHRAALARRPPTRDTGRAAAGRAGSFNICKLLGLKYVLIGNNGILMETAYVLMSNNELIIPHFRQ